ncbi:hypothetical protein Tco_1227487 [Tanacetum coccineum]
MNAEHLLSTEKAIDAEGMDMEIDLSNLGTSDPFLIPLLIGSSVSGKEEKQCAHFFGVTISDEQAQSGIFVRVTSAAQSKFKQDNSGGYSIALQVHLFVFSLRLFKNLRLRKVTYDMKTKNRADRGGFVSVGEKEVRGTVPSVSKVGPPKFELQMGHNVEMGVLTDKELLKLTDAEAETPSRLISASMAHAFALFVAVSVSANVSGERLTSEVHAAESLEKDCNEQRHLSGKE